MLQEPPCFPPCDEGTVGAISSAASQSSRGWFTGTPPSLPKSLDAFCNPSPKCHCQSRLTATRANRGFSGAVSQSQNGSNRPSRKSILAGANGQPGSTG